jgi:alpha-glucosidase (family GH31 glycosyl hydrolase)
MKTITDLKDPLGVRWMPIIDAGVGYIGDSGLTGNEKDLFIKSAETNESLIGCVWPGAAYFVDFNNPEAK